MSDMNDLSPEFGACLHSRGAGAGAVAPAGAVTLAEKRSESGCTGKPVAISSGFYKCSTKSGAERILQRPRRPRHRGARRSAPNGKATPTPSRFPRVDADTQKGRDELRRKVLTDELVRRGEARSAQGATEYGTGAPPPLPEERTDAQKYADRIARLRQSVQLHERNVEALKKELAVRSVVGERRRDSPFGRRRMARPASAPVPARILLRIDGSIAAVPRGRADAEARALS